MQKNQGALVAGAGNVPHFQPDAVYFQKIHVCILSAVNHLGHRALSIDMSAQAVR
jgi:hypothetical protein